MNWGFGEIDTFVGDIWELATHAVVSAIHSEMRPANQQAIDLLRRAGHSVERELSAMDNLSMGQAVITSAGTLQCEKIVHIAVTTLSRRATIELYREALQNALMLAYHSSLRSLAIPAMYNEPGELTTSVVARTTVEMSMQHLRRAKFPGRIVFVVPTDYVHNTFLKEIDRIRFSETPI